MATTTLIREQRDDEVVDVVKVVSLDCPDPKDFESVIGPRMKAGDQEERVADTFYTGDCTCISEHGRPVSERCIVHPWTAGSSKVPGGHTYEDAFALGEPDIKFRETFLDLTEYFAAQDNVDSFLSANGLALGTLSAEERKEHALAYATRHWDKPYIAKRIGHCSECGGVGHNKRTCTA